MECPSSTGAMAEFERNVIRKQTHAGLDALCVQGRKGERAKTFATMEPRILARAKTLYASKQNTISEIMHITGFTSCAFLYRWPFLDFPAFNDLL